MKRASVLCLTALVPLATWATITPVGYPAGICAGRDGWTCTAQDLRPTLGDGWTDHGVLTPHLTRIDTGEWKPLGLAEGVDFGTIAASGLYGGADRSDVAARSPSADDAMRALVGDSGIDARLPPSGPLSIGEPGSLMLTSVALGTMGLIVLRRSRRTAQVVARAQSTRTGA